MIDIILNEWKAHTRNKVFVKLNIFFLITLLFVSWISIFQNAGQDTKRLAAQQKVRSQWDNLQPMNPHSAAHYGLYAFKPLNLLNSIDGGVNDYTGNVLKLEGHVQNEIAYSEVSQSLSISKFGKLKPSLIFQYLIPLMLIFLAFNRMTNERKTGRLKLLLFQGASINQLIFGKAFSIWLYGVFLMSITIIFQLFANNFDSQTIQRLILIIFSYSAYYYILSFLVTFISAISHSSTTSLSSILVIWILWTIFIPKIWGDVVDKIYPLPSRQAFNSKMVSERSEGIDGHNPYDKRREQLKNKYLNKYDVDSLSQLPINFDGIVMQEDEEYGNQIWDKHFGNNYAILQKQKELYQKAGIINPFVSLNSLSMGFCGTDMLHHLEFLKKSEEYRRYLVKSLNDEHAYGGSKTGDWKWTVDNVFFRSIDRFNYTNPKIINILNYYISDILFLVFWIFFISIIIIIYKKDHIF